MTDAERIQFQGREVARRELPEPYRPPALRNRDELLHEVESAWRELESFLSSLGPSDFGRIMPGEGEGDTTWTIKDAVAHLSAWRRNAALVAEAQGQPGAEPINEFPSTVLGFRTHDFNAELLRTTRAASLEEVQREHRDSHGALVRAIEGVPESHLIRDGHSVLWLTPAIGHPRMHLADMRRALESAP